MEGNGSTRSTTENGLVRRQSVVTTIDLPEWLGGVELRIEQQDSSDLMPRVLVREPGEEWVSVDEVEGRVRAWRLATYEQENVPAAVEPGAALRSMGAVPDSGLGA